jgi:hypothetical protein
MTNPAEHDRINSAMRAAYRERRLIVHDDGRILRAPSDVEIEESTEEATSTGLARADAGASGAIPVDPVASINDAIRTSARRRGA